MNFSMNGSPKELTAFLVALACNYAGVRGIQPPVVVEVPGPVNPPPDPGTSYDDPVKPETAKAEPEPCKGPSIASAPDVSPEVEKERSLGIPRPEEQKADEPKTRKSRAKKAADEVKPETGKQEDGAVKDESTKPEVEKPLTDNPTLPDGWDTWSVTKRRLWVETAPHLSPAARAKLLGDNPVPETQKTEQ